MKQFILKIPEGETVDTFEDELLEAIKSVKGQFPEGAVVGSQAVDGYELKLVTANADTNALENLFALFALDWEVFAESGVDSDPSLILPYMIDRDIFDEDGEIVGSQTFDISALQTISGNKWQWL